MSVAAGESHILNLTVRPESQGQGIGRRMLENFIRLARRHNADTLMLEVRPSNTTAGQLLPGARRPRGRPDPGPGPVFRLNTTS